MPRASRLLYVLALLVASCANPEPRTQVQVWIRSDARLAATLQQVRVAVVGGRETPDASASPEMPFDVTVDETKPGEHNFPFSFSVLPGAESSVDLLVRGFDSRADDAQAIVERRASALFVPRRTVDMSILLEVTPCEVERGALCDPIANCGCAPLDHCQVRGDQVQCVHFGERAQGQACENHDDCAAGLSCAFGACRSACRVHADCRASVDVNAECVRRGDTDFGFCAEPCGRLDSPKCADGLICSPLKLPDVQGNFCMRVEDPCTTVEDEVCDEAGDGTGFCAANSDTEDCCYQPRSSKRCELLTQCGCFKAQACRTEGASVFGDVDTACGEIGTIPIGATCEDSAQCEKGAICAQSICRQLCNDSWLGRCQSGQCEALTFPNGRRANNVGICREPPCDWNTQEPCRRSEVCAQLGTATECYVQPIRCPDILLDNGVCDELTRICAPNSDSDADCERE